MQIANVLVKLGGDAGNTVPKDGVTPSEVAVLQSIHGSDAVYDIDPTGVAKTLDEGGQPTQKDRNNREELARLRQVYGGARNVNNQSHVDVLFPGAAAPVFTSFSELELDESLFKPKTRANPDDAPVKTEAEANSELDGMSKTKLRKVADERGVAYEPTDDADALREKIKLAPNPQPEDDVEDISGEQSLLG